MIGDLVVDEAMSWRRTPYVWRAATKGLGADCGTFVWHTYNKFYNMPPLPERYHEAWLCEQGPDYARDLVVPIARPVKRHEVRPGDYVAVKFGFAFIHSAICLGDDQIIHCYGRKGVGGVTVQPLTVFRGRDMMFMRLRKEFIRPEYVET